MFEELIQKIDETVEKLKSEEASTSDVLKVITESLKEGFANVSDKIGELEAMADTNELVVKVLNAWKDQLVKAGLEVATVEGSEPEAILATLAEIEIPTQEELQTKLDEVTAERDQLASQIAEAELSVKTEARLAELEEAGIKIPETLTEQITAKIRSMSDEEFTAYKQEQVALLEANVTTASSNEDVQYASVNYQHRGINLSQDDDGKFDFSPLFK